MQLALTIDSHPVLMRLNWGQGTWKIVHDPSGAWARLVTRTRRGDFSRKGWDVLWINDPSVRHQDKTRLIIWDAPRSQRDTVKNSGQGRIYSVKAGRAPIRRIAWNIKQPKVPSATLTGLRQYIVTEFKQRFLPGKYITPLPPQKTPKDPHPANSTFFELTCTLKSPAVGTNCYALGAGLARFAGRYKGIRKNSPDMTAYIEKYSLSATSGLPSKGKNKSWTDADGTSLPRPGDFYALLLPGLQNTRENRRRDAEYSHVGVLLGYENGGRRWITADFGQVKSPGGYGAHCVREYAPGSNTLTSPKPQSGYGPRVVAGWINIDSHFGG